MKNAGSSTDGPGKISPKDIVGRTFDFAGRIVLFSIPAQRVPTASFLILHF
jgi:hypothetical protein